MDTHQKTVVMPRTKSTATKAAKKATSSSRDTTPKRGNDDDRNLTLKELTRLPLEVLRLKCQDLKLLRVGKRAQLAERIYEHHHPTVIEPPPHVDLGDDSEPTVEYDGELEDDPTERENLTEEDDDDGSDHARTTRAQGNRGPEREITPDPDEEASEKAELPENQLNIELVMQAVIERTIGEQVSTMGAELEALRSLIATKNRSAANPPTRTSPRK